MAAPMKNEVNKLLRNENEVWKPNLTSEEYAKKLKDCQSLGNLFHNYYIYGVRPTCYLEKQDFINAVRWETSKAEDAKNALQAREGKLQSRHPHVWEFRQEKIPPKEWTIPVFTDNNSG
ncbi:UPF0545 protein C22orf39 homolog isoform X2 [Anneissia japonica]|uniref:UPF0545 protein C22orf39 homolog isoform X2 n=1 Tax=Anneissia japonica TaxID=1529436 RepID=UPI001425642C|nr:UPF0545 protein C22orf39 homolog isoform X2 [Anneissia japonica]